MGALTDRADTLEKRALLAVKNIPHYAQLMPGVSESVALLRDTLALVRCMAEQIEGGNHGK